MSGVAPVEYDFMGLEKAGASDGFQPQMTSPLRRPFSHSLFSGRLLETLLASGATAPTAETCRSGSPKHPVSNPVRCSTSASPPSPAVDTRRWSPPPMPAMTPASRSSAGSPPTGPGAPLTIFYNGTVFVFDLPPQKAEAIIGWLETAITEMKRQKEGRADGIAAVAANRGREEQQKESFSLLETADIPLARRRSLLRFLDRRKERVTVVPPCVCSNPSSIDSAGETSQRGYGQRRKRQKLTGQSTSLISNPCVSFGGSS